MPVEDVKSLEKTSSTEEVSEQNGRWTQMNVCWNVREDVDILQLRGILRYLWKCTEVYKLVLHSNAKFEAEQPWKVSIRPCTMLQLFKVRITNNNCYNKYSIFCNIKWKLLMFQESLKIPSAVNSSVCYWYCDLLKLFHTVLNAYILSSYGKVT